MKCIVLIACASKKLAFQAQAKDLYRSDLFQKQWRFAKSAQPDDIYILSAKHGLVAPQQYLEPYDETLNTMSAVDRRLWAAKVLASLEKISSLDQTEYILLAGKKYWEYLVPHMPHHQVPFEGLRIGEQLRELTRLTP